MAVGITYLPFDLIPPLILRVLACDITGPLRLVILKLCIHIHCLPLISNMNVVTEDSVVLLQLPNYLLLLLLLGEFPHKSCTA